MSSTSASSTCPNTGQRFKRPVSVLVVVATRQGDVLLMERAEPVGFWQSVTGSLMDGETAYAAAQRELYEETGIEVEGNLEDCRITSRFPIIEAWRHRYASDVSYNREHVFRVILENRTAARLNPTEHLRYKWLPRNEAARQASSWTNQIAILALVGNSFAPTKIHALA